MMQTENNDNRIYLHYTGWTATTLSPMVSYTCISMENCQKQSLVEDDYYPVKAYSEQEIKQKIEASSENGKYKAKAETRISAPYRL